MSKRFLIVGKQFSGLSNSIEARGDSWFLVRDSKRNEKNDAKNSINVDFSNKQSVLNAVLKLHDELHFDGAITIYENYIVDCARIADKLNLPGLPVDSAIACTDKELMRSLFLKCKIQISPAYRVIKNVKDAIEFTEKYGYPVILKPANLAKSLLVLKCANKQELTSNLTKTSQNIKSTYKKFAPHEKPKMLIEQFMEGSIHSVEAFIGADGKPQVLDAIVDYQTGYDIGFDDNFHYSRVVPSKLSHNEQIAVREVAALGCKTLGMKNSAAHIEIIMTKDGPRIVEIGARNGGYRERMHKLANGIDVLNIQLDIKLGKAPSIAINKHEPCAVLELFPKKPGIFEGIQNEAELKKLRSLKYFKVKQNVGSFVGKSGDGYKMCAIVILHNESKDQFMKDLMYVNNKVRVTIQ